MLTQHVTAATHKGHEHFTQETFVAAILQFSSKSKQHFACEANCWFTS